MSQFETATLAGGCFWCTEAIFNRLKASHQLYQGMLHPTYPIPRIKQYVRVELALRKLFR